ncbi:hypothetical protein BIY27_22320 [Gibbsiella quercinecans]|uniref:PAAR domain-containing protein n=1 Tax=Gibbsiella quercinecans TaxID=929813 RepID=UPI000EF1A445|nr:PAAR domain-containing protein [Gibbsiella quercinecans]RLM04475.1 hypothetical protein BIY27_22320 [Gibbsiella quercinecans]
MAEFSAARELDEIAHTASKGWMIAGLIGGAVLGAAAVVVTGGTALIAVSAVAAGACAAGGLGEVLGSMSWAPRHVTGILKDGSPNVFINDRAAIRAHLSYGECDEHSGTLQLVAEGSIKVYINDFPAARVGDKLTCSAEILNGSSNVFIGGEKTQTDDINPEIPAWINWTLLGVGVAATVVIAGPAIAIMSTTGSIIGGTVGNYFGGEWFGEGSDRQKWMALGGAFAGGFAGIKSGPKIGSKANDIIYHKTYGVPLKQSKFNEIINIEKGLRPLPDNYLSNRYINYQLKEFEGGASRIVTRSSYEEYGIGKPDAGKSEFVLSNEKAASIMNETNGDPIQIAQKLGIPEQQLQNDSLVIVKFKPSDLYSPRLPSGNEWGANDQWFPGGKLPGGDSEAIVDTKGMIKGIDYEVIDITTGKNL